MHLRNEPVVLSGINTQRVNSSPEMRFPVVKPYGLSGRTGIPALGVTIRGTALTQ